MIAADWKHRLEAAAVGGLYSLFQALPVERASALGGWLGRGLGPRLPVTRRAERNLSRVMPELTTPQRRAVIRAMWDNLGRNAGEFPHLPDLAGAADGRVEIIGAEHVRALRDDGRPGLMFSGHLGNWELLAFAAAHLEMRLHLIYRASNNPHLQWLYQRGRSIAGSELLPKGAAGARRALELLRRNEHLAMLMDQKMNDGIAVPFFGIPAMTAPALAQFALKFRCPVLPAHTERLDGCRFRIIVEPPLELPASGDRQADILTLMTEVNRRLEGWIRRNPGQWLWLHKRWPNPQS